jgi:hypothetical protein
MMKIEEYSLEFFELLIDILKTEKQQKKYDLRRKLIMNIEHLKLMRKLEPSLSSIDYILNCICVNRNKYESNFWFKEQINNKYTFYTIELMNIRTIHSLTTKEIKCSQLIQNIIICKTLRNCKFPSELSEKIVLHYSKMLIDELTLLLKCKYPIEYL